MTDERGSPEIVDAESDFVVLRVGQSVGRYQIGPVLGQGGFGITYRATDSQLGRDVAIKEYLPAALAVRQDGVTVVPRSKDAADDFAWGRDRFVAEGRTLAALHHAPGIVRVHDFLEANGTAYIVMELLGGETLQKRLARQSVLDAAAIDRIARPLLEGLEQVHKASFLHRDIKPANVLLDDEGRPTLIDFGASRISIAGRSQAMTAVFTPGYAAVEQFTSAMQGPWTDIYGLAATLHHAVTGRAPPSSIDRMLDDTYVPLAGRMANYPPGLLAGIDAGLAVRAAERPQSIAAWRGMLLQVGVSGVAAAATAVIRPQSIAATPSATPSAAPARTRWGLVLAGGGTLAAVVLGGVNLFLPAAPTPTVPVTVASPQPSSPLVASAQDLAMERAREELEQARRERQNAADEVARLRAEADARRKADEEAALRRKIEEELRQKAEEEAKQKADTDLAARIQAAQEEKRRADSTAVAAAQIGRAENDKKTAELAEAALLLDQADRRRLQVALTLLGFATGGTDGAFGPRSREAIAAWQRENNRAATGYFTAEMRAALLREAAPALARYDEEQKVEDAKMAPPPAVVAQVPGPAAAGKGVHCEGTFRSQWCRDAYEGFPGNCWGATMTIKGGMVSDGWASAADRSKRNVITGTIDEQGTVRLTYSGWGTQIHINESFVAQMSGTVANGILTAAGQARVNGRRFTVRVSCQ